jgi:isopropylmalate/homocitrate/citramalate synthase
VTHIVVCDVGPRDGLQNERDVLPASTRAELAARLAAAGVPRVEAASFVRDDLVPQMADAESVVAALPASETTTFAGLVLNERGYERLRETSLREVHVSFASTETFQQRNAGSSVAEGLAAAARVVQRAHEDGRRAGVTIGTAFGCPFEGEVDPGWVLELAAQVASDGADEILFADTIGVGVPRQARTLVTAALAHGVPVGVHLHDTRHSAVACAWAAVEAGATLLDGSIGGIGGCPFAPRATGNVATEDLVYLLDREGVQTEIDLGALIGVAEWLAGVLGRELPGRVYRAGAWPVS